MEADQSSTWKVLDLVDQIFCPLQDKWLHVAWLDYM